MDEEDPGNLKSRDFICACGKNYLSYAALFTHIKQKHDGKVYIKSLSLLGPSSVPAQNASEAVLERTPSTNLTSATQVLLFLFRFRNCK